MNVIINHQRRNLSMLLCSKSQIHSQFFTKTLCTTRRNVPSYYQNKPTVRNTVLTNLSISEHKESKTKRIVLILGSSSSFGTIMARHLKTKCDCTIIGADSYVNEIGSVHFFLPIPSVENATFTELIKDLNRGLQVLFGERVRTIDVIICANGVRIMDPIITNDDDEGQLRYLGGVHEIMMKANYNPVVVAGELARRYMTLNHGLFVMVGSTSAIKPTPGMIAYGSSKSAAHHYLHTLGTLTGKALSRQDKSKRSSVISREIRRNNEYLDELTAVGLVPTTTLHESRYMDRKLMRHDDDDFGLYTQEVADEIGKWIEQEKIRPHSGSFIKVLRIKGRNHKNVDEDKNTDDDERTEFRLCR